MARDFIPTARNVLALWRWARANAGRGCATTVPMDWSTSFTADEALAWLRETLQRRITAGLGYQERHRPIPAPRGRKWDGAYQLGLARSAAFLRGERQWALNPWQPFQCADVARRLPHVVAAWQKRNLRRWA